jgi:hypothetical protein
MAKIDRLFVDKHPKALTSAEHRPSIVIDGYDQPPDYYTKCSCGWIGRTFITYVANWPYPQYLRKFVDTFTPEALLAENHVFGALRDAQREILEHLALPLEDKITKRVETVNAKAYETGNDALTSAIKLGELAKEVQWLLIARDILEKTPRVERAKPFNADVYAAYRELTKSSFSNPMIEMDTPKLEAFVEDLAARIQP